MQSASGARGSDVNILPFLNIIVFEVFILFYTPLRTMIAEWSTFVRKKRRNQGKFLQKHKKSGSIKHIYADCFYIYLAATLD